MTIKTALQHYREALVLLNKLEQKLLEMSSGIYIEEETPACIDLAKQIDEVRYKRGFFKNKITELEKKIETE